jgi:hypothetical protein
VLNPYRPIGKIRSFGAASGGKVGAVQRDEDDDRTEVRIDRRTIEQIEARSAPIVADYHLTLFLDAHDRGPKSSLELDEWVERQGIKVTTDALWKHVARHYDRLKRQGFLSAPCSLGRLSGDAQPSQEACVQRSARGVRVRSRR